ncbi:MAG: hypothetical protein ACSNEK_08025 [Parachlamydiaceae bacterium]
MLNYYVSGACHPLTNCFSCKSRLGFEGIEELSSSKKGIRYHNSITAFFLKLFCFKKIVNIQDARGKIYHLNRGSLSNWLIKYHPLLRSNSPKSLRPVTEYAMGSWLDDVLKKKSPTHIVRMSTIKNELGPKLYRKRLLDGLHRSSTERQALAQEIDLLKKELDDLEHQKPD